MDEAAFQRFYHAFERIRVRREKSAKPIGEHSAVIRRTILCNPDKSLHEITAAWHSLIPAALQTSSNVISWRNGVLTVETTNATWKAQTELFHKQAILAALRAILPSSQRIRDLKIRLKSQSR